MPTFKLNKTLKIVLTCWKKFQKKIHGPDTYLQEGDVSARGFIVDLLAALKNDGAKLE